MALSRCCRLFRNAVYCWRPVSVHLRQTDCLHLFFIHYRVSGSHSLLYSGKTLSAPAIVTGMVHSTQSSVYKLGNERLEHAANAFNAASVLILAFLEGWSPQSNSLWIRP